MASPSRRTTVLGTTAALTLALVTPGIASASGTSAPRARIDAAPAWTAHAPRIGKTPGSSVQHMRAVLKLRDAAGAEALARAVSDPQSSQYGHYLTAAQWRSRFAPTASDVAKVTAWLKASGFTVTAVPANHRFVAFTGTAAQTEAAFQTSLQTFSKRGMRFSAPATGLSVPAALARPLAGVTGLDTSALSKPSHVGGSESAKASGSAASSSTAPVTSPALPPPDPVFRNAKPCSAYFGEKLAPNLPQILKNPLTVVPCGYVPAQLRGAYGTAAAQSQGYDGRGATVAVVDAYASKYILSDAQTYAQRNDPSHPLRSSQFSQNLPASYRYIKACSAPGWYGEETLDVEAVHAMAPGANILYVGASSCDDGDLAAAVNTVVDNHLAQIITNSYGEPESDAAQSPTGVLERHQTYIQAAAQGISVMFSSGDSGDEIANTGVRQTDMDASDSYVTAVGGTSLAVGASNNYLFEQGWGTGKSVLESGAWVPNPPAYLYGSGGGTSRIFYQPWYQKGVVPSGISHYFHMGRAFRAVPDVAMDGDPNTGFKMGQSQTFPDGSVRYSEYRIGGTSLSSPLLAGVTAVANQVAGRPLGFLNPKLYSLVGTAALHDVNHGRAVTDGVVRYDFVNGFDRSDGIRVSLRTLNQTGTIYTRKGYDDVTGVGTPRGVDYLNAIVSASGATTGLRH